MDDDEIGLAGLNLLLRGLGEHHLAAVFDIAEGPKREVVPAVAKVHVERQTDGIGTAALLVGNEFAPVEEEVMDNAVVPFAEQRAVVTLVLQADEVTNVTLAIVAEGVGFFARVAPLTVADAMLLPADDRGCGTSVETLADL